jgi:hypothetical protein
MESEVLLSPSSGNAGYAIYTYDALTLPNGFDLSGDGVSSPDVYSRGDYTCENSAESDGNVFVAVGTATLGNSCLVRGSLQARGNITMDNTARIGADAYSSRGGLTLSNSATVGRDVNVFGAFGGSTSSVGGTVTARNGAGGYLTDPIEYPMVYVGYDPSKWQAAGFSISATTSCDDIKTQMFTVTVKTVFYGDCAIDFSNNNSGLKLKTDVALFLTGGLKISNNFGLASDSAATTRNLWVIVPAGTGARPVGWTDASCAGAAGITAGNKTAIDSSVHVFMYSCGTVDVSNNSFFYGQIYARRVTVANSFKMRFVSLPPAGTDLGGQPALPGFKVEVVYKRET